MVDSYPILTLVPPLLAIGLVVASYAAGPVVAAPFGTFAGDRWGWRATLAVSSAAVSAIWMIGWYTVISCSPVRMRCTPASSASWPVTTSRPRAISGCRSSS